MKTNLLNVLSEPELEKLVSRALKLFEQGLCCPVMCQAPRGSRPCGAPEEGIKVASFAIHDGEEPPVSGWNGAGNIFFSGCSAKCLFCQNWPISHNNNGKIYNSGEFSEKIKKLIDKKVHNINFVTGDHFLGKVIESLWKVREAVNLPLIYNCSGCHNHELFEILLKTMDIFLFDVKYCDNTLSSKYSNIQNYTEYNLKCLEMLLEADIPWIEDDLGLLKRGVIIRHLVLPDHIDNSLQVIELLNDFKKRGLNFKLSLMSQYFPAHKALDIEVLNTKVASAQYRKIAEAVEFYEIEGWTQSL